MSENNRTKKRPAPKTAYAPGVSGNPRGRPKGVKNKVTSEVRQIAQGLLSNPRYAESLKARLESGTILPGVEAMLWHYAYGKPKETIDLNINTELSETIAKARARARST
jgi:hypothetical protein